MDKPETFMIEGEEVGPSYVFGSGKDPTDRQERMMKKYVILRHHFNCQIPDMGIEGRPAHDRLWTDEAITQYLDNVPGPGKSAAGWFPCDIDRMDGNHQNRRASNLRPACHSHNSIWANTVQRRAAYPAGTGGGERKRQVGGSSSATDKRILDLSRGYEVAGRSFIFDLLLKARKKDEVVDPDKARIDMRNETGMSRPTSYSVMERLTSGSEPILDSGRDQVTGASGLRFHNSNCYNMTLEQINAEYPARGNLAKKGTLFD